MQKALYWFFINHSAQRLIEINKNNDNIENNSNWWSFFSSLINNQRKRKNWVQVCREFTERMNECVLTHSACRWTGLTWQAAARRSWWPCCAARGRARASVWWWLGKTTSSSPESWWELLSSASCPNPSHLPLLFSWLRPFSALPLPVTSCPRSSPVSTQEVASKREMCQRVSSHRSPAGHCWVGRVKGQWTHFDSPGLSLSPWGQTFLLALNQQTHCSREAESCLSLSVCLYIVLLIIMGLTLRQGWVQ